MYNALKTFNRYAITKIIALMIIMALLLMGVAQGAASVYAADTGSYSRGVKCLNSLEKNIYDQLLTQIKQIAEGKKSDSTIQVDLSSRMSKKRYTASDLGLSTINTSSGKYTEEAKNAVFNREIGSFDTGKIVDALLMDLPYELYWFDKTAECTQGLQTSFSGNDSSIALSSVSLVFNFPVSADYSQGGVRHSFKLNTSRTEAASKVANTAKSIVSKAASKSDYDKLVYYKDEILRLASYNHSVASDPVKSSKYGDPYQLIYVFDGDNSTSVTCEGYSKAFKFLCDLTTFNNPSIHCSLVSGIMSGGTGAGPHTWNLVHMDDGNNYLVDVTNCDSGTIGYSDGLFLKGDPNGNASSYSKTLSGKKIAFTYDAEAKSLYSSAELTIAKSDYKPSQSSNSGQGSKEKASNVWKRLYGNGRYDTMKAIVDEGFTKTGGTVVVATGTGFKDALAASALAGLDDGPVVLTDGKNLSNQARDILVRLRPTKIYIAGGALVVTDNVANAIKAATGITPKRIAGQNSSATSAELALEGKGRWKDATAIIATNKSFKDALSVAPIAYAKSYPILLADNGKSLSEPVLNAIRELGIKNVIIVGGTGAVSADVENQVRGAGASIKVRLAGANGAATSAAIAEWGIKNGLSANKMGVATSQNYPDALAGAALAGHNNAVLVLADDKAVTNASFPKTYKSAITKAYVFGGSSAVGTKTWNTLVDSIS